MLIDSLDQLLTTLVGERRYLKDRPLVAEPPDEVLDACRPGIGVDQVGSTLGKWLGMPDSDIAQVFPNIANFTTKNLGFI